MPRAILVPVDGSKFAEHVLPYALGIARRTGATLHMALVHAPAEISAASYPLADVLEVQATEDRKREAAYMAALADRMAESGVALVPALLGGHVADALAGYVEDHGIDLVAMTTHGRGGLQRAWLGSTTDGLVRRCGVPLLLVRPSEGTREIGPGSDVSFRQIVAGLDGSETAERALAGALRLGITRDAAVLVLRVMQPFASSAAPYLPHTIQLTENEMSEREAHPRRYLARVAASPALAGRTVQTRLVVDYEPAAAILEAADSHGADLIVVGTHGRGGLRRMLLGSVADKVIRGTRRAVLVHRGTRGLARASALIGSLHDQSEVRDGILTE
jgi:nucleotide-binding universal stress UspA family protein